MQPWCNLQRRRARCFDLGFCSPCAARRFIGEPRGLASGTPSLSLSTKEAAAAAHLRASVLVQRQRSELAAMGLGTRFVSKTNGAALLVQSIYRGNTVRRLVARAYKHSIQQGVSEGAGRGRRLDSLVRLKESKWAKVRALSKSLQEVQASYSGAKMQGELREARAARASGEVILNASDQSSLEAIPLWQQGDMSLYTQAKIEARYNLRHHRLVLAELQRWWLTILRSRPDRSVDGIEHDEYIELSNLIFKALVPVYDPTDASTSAEEDWISDCKGAPFLSRGLFQDSLFELCDVRTYSLNL